MMPDLSAAIAALPSYLATVGMATFLLMGLDKRLARLRLWRIPEKTLFLFAMIGGAPGGWLGMLFFRHKTRRPKFRIGFPLLSLLWAGIYLYLTKMI